MVSGSISLPSEGFFSPFPHGTGSLSVTEEYLAVEGGPPSFTQDFTCPALLRIPLGRPRFRLLDSHHLWLTFPDHSAIDFGSRCGVLQPRPHLRGIGLGSSRFARRYYGNLILISLPPGTEMFHFPGLAPLRVPRHDSWWVSPFGHPRIKACFLLPVAFRRLLRPSSPLCAKASTMCP